MASVFLRWHTLLYVTAELTCREVVCSSAVLSNIEAIGKFVSRSKSQHGVVVQAVVTNQHTASGLQYLFTSTQ